MSPAGPGLFLFQSWKGFIALSISSIGLFRLLTSRFNFDGLDESRNASISFRLSNLIEYKFLNIPLHYSESLKDSTF